MPATSGSAAAAIHPALRIMSGYYATNAMDRIVTSAAASVLFCTVLLAQNPARPPRPGVKTPGVKIPIERLKPDAVFTVGGHPDWLAIDESAWVSNEPSDNVSRLDPKTNTVGA